MVSEVKRIRSIRQGLVSVLAIVLVEMVNPSWSADQGNSPSNERLLPSRINGRYMLLNHLGETVTDRSFGDRFQLIYFGYTGCPDVCPNALVVITEALRLLGPRADSIQPILISVDPDRDTPAVLRDYVTYFHPRLVGLTGSNAMVERTAQNFRVRYEKVQLPEDPPDVYRVDHSAGVFFMGPDGRFLVKFANSATAPQIADRIRDFLP